MTQYNNYAILQPRASCTHQSQMYCMLSSVARLHPLINKHLISLLEAKVRLAKNLRAPYTES
jgi:hypothetical protein